MGLRGGVTALRSCLIWSGLVQVELQVERQVDVGTRVWANRTKTMRIGGPFSLFSFLAGTLASAQVGGWNTHVPGHTCVIGSDQGALGYRRAKKTGVRRSKQGARQGHGSRVLVANGRDDDWGVGATRSQVWSARVTSDE